MWVQNASTELQDFIEAAKIPVIHTLPAKTVLPDAHPYSVGNLGKIGTKRLTKLSKMLIY